MAGFRGLLDFVGYPVGIGAFVPSGNVFAAGRRVNLLRALAWAQQERSLLDQAQALALQQATARRLRDSWVRRVEREQMLRTRAVWGSMAMVLAEV